MFAFVVGTGLVYGATWVARKVPSLLGALVPVLYVREKQRADRLQEIATEMDLQLKRRLSPYYDENTEFSLVQLNNVPHRLRYLQDKKLLLTDEELFFLSKLIEAANKGEETPFDISKLVRATEERLLDPEVAKQFS